MKTFKVKNYKGNLVESLSKFQKSYKGMKIVEAVEDGDDLKIRAEESDMEHNRYLVKDGKRTTIEDLFAFDKYLKSNGINVSIDLDYADNKWYIVDYNDDRIEYGSTNKKDISFFDAFQIIADYQAKIDNGEDA